jgi:hypothetical protein
MKTCPHCGVYVEEDHTRCPLCYTPLDGDVEDAPRAEPGYEPPDAHPRFWLLEVLSLLAAVGAIVVFAADFAFGFALTWSPVPLVSIAFAWVVLGSVIALGRRGLLLGGVLTLATLAYLLVLDLLTGGVSWFPALALPLVLLGAAVGGVLVWLGRRRGVSALPAVGLALVGGGLYAVGVELIVAASRGAGAAVSWSVVVLACSVALSLVVFLIHRRLRLRHTSLERIFHL